MMPDIQPMFDTNEVPIVITPHKGFVHCMGVLVQSIIENSNVQNNYDIIVLHKELDDTAIEKFEKQMAGKSNFAIRFFNVYEYSMNYELFKKKKRTIGFPCATYYRLFIPELFRDFEKVIYIDADMITLVDIAKLLEIELQDNLVGAVRDICGNWHYYEENGKVKAYRDKILGLKNPDNYFNAGMVVFNIKAFQRYVESGAIWKKADEYEWISRDQDILNSLCNESVTVLPFAWNTIKTCNDEAKKYMIAEDKIEWERADDEAKIVHFAGRFKPWSYLNVSFQQQYWEYAKASPFLEDNFWMIGEDRLKEKVAEKNLEGKIGLKYILDLMKDWIIVRFCQLLGKGTL